MYPQNTAYEIIRVRTTHALRIAAATVLLAPALADVCGPDIAALWSMDSKSSNLSFTLSSDCSIPTPHELSDLLADRHVHVAGDPMLRIPVQHFELAWEECVIRAPKREALHSSRKDAQPEDHELCHLAYGRNFYSWLKRPMDHFALSYESVAYIRDQRIKSEWWHKWATGLDKLAPDDFHPLAPMQVLGDSARMGRLPDVLVLGNWARHAENWQGEKTLAAFLEEYERELRAFVKALVSSSSWSRWWSRGRVVWRLALPAERHTPPQPVPLLYTQACVDGSNEVALRVLGELAPEVRILNQAALVLHADEDAAAALAVPLLGNGILYKPPVQVLLMRHALAFILAGIHETERSGSAVPVAAPVPMVQVQPSVMGHDEVGSVSITPASSSSPTTAVEKPPMTQLRQPDTASAEDRTLGSFASLDAGVYYSGWAASHAMLGTAALLLGYLLAKRT